MARSANLCLSTSWRSAASASQFHAGNVAAAPAASEVVFRKSRREKFILCARLSYGGGRRLYYGSQDQSGNEHGDEVVNSLEYRERSREAVPIPMGETHHEQREQPEQGYEGGPRRKGLE